MNLSTILSPDCTACAVPAASKKRILEQISQLAANKIPELSQQELLASLINREKLGSTGIGNGIAIPHGRLPTSSQVVAVLLTSEKPIGFDAIDNQGVDIFFALFVPEDQCQQHLQTLASIAETFGNKQVCKKVRKITDGKALYDFITTHMTINS
jgi:PTS system nitrogen regulatory IIA component